MLNEGQRDAFFQPTISDKKASLFDHCALALDKSLEVGAPRPSADGHRRLERWHGRVGEGGKGESVWLGWFLYSTLTAFADLADDMTIRSARRRGGSMPRLCRMRWSATAGTATGIAAPISTMDRRSVRRQQ